ncbi:uncharacterized protein K452DRAFT_340399 [Aplosporella prunicola CBS 121167]|uniref:Mif2/CENP-C cupin domain-containing protein n=1 Tax=Aplosporella prunicola CBS 121167 TaxID=1176127 RepID=A0A6A6BSU0_9PEZI|nr:uncharacterized protein K452DRAFT_340399 [Aplosporella prunicola CBS 121167]KAF2145897.1 hypothetical protein K452DRAFT_340399 [Aplosporella prunicola CBS 121167]
MAPADTPGKKKRDNNYFNVGVQGRKTGITLKDTGIRDEHGMEPIDGIFSSPEKSPPKRPAPKPADTTLTSSDMDVQQSSMPEPADALSARRSIRPTKTSYFPPPMARSPIKTNIGSSPRRQSSMGPPSQMRRSARTPDRAASHPVVARKLDFGGDEQTSETIRSSGSRSSRTRGKERADIYDLRPSPVPDQNQTHDESIVEEETQDFDFPVNGVNDDSPLPGDGGDSLQILPDVEQPLEGTPLVERPKTKRGRPKKDAESVQKENEEEPAIPTSPPASKKGRGRPKKANGLVSAKASNAAASKVAPGRSASKPATNGQVDEESAMDLDVPTEEPSFQQQDTEMEVDQEVATELEPEPEPPKRKRGPGKKSSKPIVQEDESEEPTEDQEPPTKRAKKKPAPKKPPPSQRDPNARITSSRKNVGKEKENEEPELQQSPAKRGSKPPTALPRSLQVLRDGTPFDDAGVKTTRSGRTSVKPLNFWQNEKIEYLHDGTKQQITRAEETEVPKRKMEKRRGRGRPRVKPEKSENAEEEDLELEEWEKSPGVMAGWVNGWDETEQVVINEGGIQEDLAFSATRIQTREVKSGNFRYAKIIGIPFFGAGMVDIPAHGSKRAKNSRRMHMAFCLLSGKVEVTVGDNLFSISKGGVWLVPRGEFQPHPSVLFPSFPASSQSFDLSLSLSDSLRVKQAASWRD